MRDLVYNCSCPECPNTHYDDDADLCLDCEDWGCDGVGTCQHVATWNEHQTAVETAEELWQ